MGAETVENRTNVRLVRRKFSEQLKKIEKVIHNFVE